MPILRNSDADHDPTARDGKWNLADPRSRFRANLHYQLQDHAILRHGWTNMAEVAPGVFRSNQPTHARFEKLHAQGIRGILNLRGGARHPRMLFEEESCRALGLTLVTVGLRARLAPETHQVANLFDAFRAIPRPFLMHCKSGADRAGFAAALYLLACEGADVATARRQLSWRFLHFRQSRTGVLDHILDLYAAARDATGIGVEEWFATAYDPDAVMAGFRP